ncbi:LLM class flavin-dependent oxidoreductase, partial [Myxococcota bacterium]|nr:LLM class flavin-dependent oxidoreductase [Myxococcota bacterium]
MERGLFYELGAESPSRFAELARETQLAESLGLSVIWCLPAMGQAGGTSASAPSVWLAALAGATQHVRLGWGVPGLWPARVAPVREAEQAATLDVASNGRVDVAFLPDTAVRRSEAEDAATGA